MTTLNYEPPARVSQLLESCGGEIVRATCDLCYLEANNRAREEFSAWFDKSGNLRYFAVSPEWVERFCNRRRELWDAVPERPCFHFHGGDEGIYVCPDHLEALAREARE